MIDFIGEVKDDYGITMQNVRDKLDIKLSDETAAQLAKRPIQYETGFTLLPGKYVIKFLARDAETGRIGTFQAAFTIPNLNREEQRDADQLRRARAASACRSATRSTTSKQKTRHEAVEPAGVRRAEADSERDARVQQEPRPVRLPAGVRARRDDDAAARRVRDASIAAT